MVTLIPISWRALAAVPGESLNNRLYPKEVLAKSAESGNWAGKPLLLDHEIKDVLGRCAGIISEAKYGIDKTRKGELKEGLWLSGFGLVEEGMYQRLVGTNIIPPIIKNVSIGGEGEGEPGVNPDTGRRVTRIIRLNPQELSVVSIPGIPEAHFADIKRITESYVNNDNKVIKESNNNIISYYLKEVDNLVGIERISKETIKEHDKGASDPDKIPLGTAGDSTVVSHAGKKFGTIPVKYPSRANQEIISKRENNPFISKDKFYSAPSGYTLEGGRIYRERRAPNYKVSPYFRPYVEPKAKSYNMFSKKYSAIEQMPSTTGNVGAGQPMQAIKQNPDKLVNEEPVALSKGKYNKPSVMTPYQDEGMMGTGSPGAAMPHSVGRKPPIQPLVKDDERFTPEEEEALDMVYSAEDNELDGLESYILGEMASFAFSGPQTPVMEASKKKWIPKKLKKGALRATAKAAGVIKGDEKIPKSWLAAKAKSGGKVGQRARLAVAFSHMKH